MTGELLSQLMLTIDTDSRNFAVVTIFVQKKIPGKRNKTINTAWNQTQLRHKYVAEFGTCPNFVLRLPKLLPTRLSSCDILWQAPNRWTVCGKFSIFKSFWGQLINHDSFQEDIKLFVNRLNSEESVIPFEYEQ